MDKKPVIAIVDDDQSAREGIVDLVSSMGFEARAFERAEDFLRSHAGHAGRIHLRAHCQPAEDRRGGGGRVHGRLVYRSRGRRIASLRKIEEDIVGSAGVGKRRQRPSSTGHDFLCQSTIF